MEGIKHVLPLRVEIAIPPDCLFRKFVESGLEIEDQHGRIRNQGSRHDGKCVPFPLLPGKQEQIDDGVGRRIHNARSRQDYAESL